MNHVTLTVIRWSMLLPDGARMLTLARSQHQHLLASWWATFSVASVASLAALATALAASLLSIRFRAAEWMLTPLVAISQSFPLQSIAPLMLIVLGIGFHTKVAVAFVIAFFPMYGACTTALKTMPRATLAHLSVCGTSFARSVLYCRVPIALPAIVSSAKVGFTLAVLGAVVAEFIQPDVGLGEVLLVSHSNYNIEMIYLCIALLVAQGIAIYSALSLLEQRLIKNRSIS